MVAVVSTFLFGCSRNWFVPYCNFRKNVQKVICNFFFCKFAPDCEVETCTATHWRKVNYTFHFITDIFCNKVFQSMNCSSWHKFLIWLGKADIVFRNYITFFSYFTSCKTNKRCCNLCVVQIKRINIIFFFHILFSLAI